MEALSLNDLRLAANSRFAANALEEALPLYSAAVELARGQLEKHADSGEQQNVASEAVEECGEQQQFKEELVIHLCNRSACLYKMEMFEEARDDAKEAVELSDGEFALQLMANFILLQQTAFCIAY